MKVTLVVPMSRAEGTPWYFPSGPGYIAAALREEHEVKVLELKAEPKSDKEIEEYIRNDNSEIYAIGGLITDYSYVKKLVSVIKKYNKIIIVGGGLATSVPDLLMKNRDIDFLIVGEGDISTKELVGRISKGGPYHGVGGIVFRENGKIITTSPSEVCNLNEISIPAYDLFPMDVYLRSNIDSPVEIPSPNMTMVTARGCPYNCTFCHRPISGKTRLRSSESILDEIRILRKRYGIKGLIFNDELTITSKKRMYNICEGISREFPDLRWGCSGRVNLMDEDLLKVMKDAGCVWMTVGIESANQNVLDLMKKQITVEQADNAYKLCRKVGINLGSTFIFGMPGENEESIKETVDFFKRNDLPIGSFFTATPFPGTELWDLAWKQGKITKENEEEFISKLDNVIHFTINFTEWTDKEFMHWKEWGETEIRKNYYKRHPTQLITDNLHSIKIAKKVLKKHGMKKTMQLALKRIKMTMRLAK